MSPLSRRDFLTAGVAAGAGLVIGFYLPHGSSGNGGGTFSPNAYLKMTPDGKITVVVVRSEMGQGVRTSLPMILAEELEADWKQIGIEQAGAGTLYGLGNPTLDGMDQWGQSALYGDQLTGGSASIHKKWGSMLRAGASAREMLITSAAQEWGVSRSTCQAENSSVLHIPSNRRLNYGQLVSRAASLPVPLDPPLKAAKDYEIIGKPIARLDVPSKVNGSAVYGIDVRLPDMKYALLARSPVIGGKVVSIDDKESKKISGVSYVGKISDSAVAVVADSVWAATEGRRVLSVTWDDGPNKDLTSTAIAKALRDASSQKGVPLYSTGDVSKVSGRRIEAAYEVPFMAHAAMEPCNGTAHYQGNKCELWLSTQDPVDCQTAVAQAVGLAADQVTVNVTLLGGGFGRRLETDYAVEAALVSKAANVPVQVLWTREDDMRYSCYRPSSYHKMSAVLDGQGWPLSFSHKLVVPSINLAKGSELEAGIDSDMKDEAALVYSFPNALVDFVRTETLVPIAFMRAVYGLETGFANECFIDELAEAAGKDPLEYRLHLLSKDEEINFCGRTWTTARMRGVLQMAAEKAGWGKPLPAGHYHGIACFGCFATYMAEVVEISMENDQPRVHRVVGAMDCGQMINPNILEQQIQGGVIFALTNALRAQITIDKGRVVQGNFDDYEPIRMREAPGVEAYFVPSTETPTGAGEPPVAPLAPALCNAVYAATKKRVRALPILR
jgi:isoquinoline 1-oxidoreductase beta subunit